MPGKLPPVEQLLIMLAEAPPRIVNLTADLTPAQLHLPPAPDEWAVKPTIARR